jgi:hypothetical protein
MLISNVKLKHEFQLSNVVRGIVKYLKNHDNQVIVFVIRVIGGIVGGIAKDISDVSLFSIFYPAVESIYS